MKKIVMALALGILGAFGAIGIGCGGDACQAAADDALAKLESCPDYVAPSGSTSASGSTTCSDADGKLQQCQADCLADVPCECLGLDKSKMCDAAAATKYTDCNAACK